MSKQIMESIAKHRQQINNSNTRCVYSHRNGQRALEAYLHSNIAYVVQCTHTQTNSILLFVRLALVSFYVQCTLYDER